MKREMVGGLLACGMLVTAWLALLGAMKTSTNSTETAITISNSNATQSTIYFSGYLWHVKVTDGKVWGPGPNYFSNYTSDIWVDSFGKLHMKIAQHNGTWYSTELISDNQMGYGTYRFYLDSDPNQIDQNAVLGLFTWDDYTFQADANSEVDVEFSKWGDPEYAKVMSYAVQPTYSLDAFYPERVLYSNFLSTPSINSFTWMQNAVSFDSSIFLNGSYVPYKSWVFDEIANPARIVWNGKYSDPVAVPRPSSTTHVHINLWQLDMNKDGIGDAPSDRKEVEVVINKFEFIPS